MEQLSTESAEPTTPEPKSETEAPSRAKLRRESEDPNCKKSSTATDAPRLDTPTTEKAEPNLAKLRRDSEEPSRE